MGLLAEGPGHGYELRKRLQQKLGPAWEINSGQLYQELGRLEEEGFVHALDETAKPGDRKRVVALSDTGATELERWFERESPGVRIPKGPEFLTKVGLGGPERSENSLAHIAAYEADCVARLEKLGASRESVPLWPLTADRVLKRCAISCEMLQVQAHLQGAMLARETVTSLKDGTVFCRKSPVARADAATVRERERAREEIFSRMAANHLDALPAEPDAKGA